MSQPTEPVTTSPIAASAGNLNESHHRVAVILLHGLCSTPDELMLLHQPLRSLGCTIEPLVIKGYSFDSDQANSSVTSYKKWVDAIQHRIQVLGQSHDKVVLIGISAGAILALASAMQTHRPPDGLVLMSTPLRRDGWAIPAWHFLLPLALYTPLGRMWQYREKPPYGVKNERVRAWIARELDARRISSAGAAILGVEYLREYDRLARHVRAHLDAVQSPRVLALHAEEDEVASLKNVTLLAAGLSSVRHFQSTILSNSYHMISLDNDRVQVLHETLGFIRSLAVSH